jgi:hypothetical protein
VARAGYVVADGPTGRAMRKRSDLGMKRLMYG